MLMTAQASFTSVARFFTRARTLDDIKNIKQNAEISTPRYIGRSSSTVAPALRPLRRLRRCHDGVIHTSSTGRHAATMVEVIEYGQSRVGATPAPPLSSYEGHSHFGAAPALPSPQ